MYAIIKAGGKQYTVKPGDVLRVEKMEAELGAEVDLKEVLLVGGEKTFVGETIGKALVTVVVTNQQRGPKLVVFKKKRRQGYRRMGGHRQPYTEIFVKSITNPEGTVEKAEAKPNVFSPERKAEKLAKTEEVRLAWKEKNRVSGGETSEDTVKASGRPTAKKVAKKATGAKKARGAKKATAKKSANKKSLKKTTKK